MFKKTHSFRLWRLIGIISLTGLMIIPSHAQEDPAEANPDEVNSAQENPNVENPNVENPNVEKPGQASVRTTIGSDGTGKFIVEAQGQLPKPPVFYTASANAFAQVGTERVEQVIQLTIKVIQGEAETLSFGLSGGGEVTEVQGENLQSWSIRQVGAERFLDLQVGEKVTELKTVIKVRSAQWKLPAVIGLTHLSPGEAVGFDSIVNVGYDPEVEGVVTAVIGFSPLDVAGRANRFQTATGGQIQLSLTRDGASPSPVELVDTSLVGQLHSDGKSFSFQLRSTAQVTEPGAEITILSGNAAVSQVPTSDNFRLRLSAESQRPVYKLVFSDVGTFPVTLDFVATLITPAADRHSMDFTIAASAVVPLTLNGLAADLEFQRDQNSVVPLRDEETWLGFLPANGRASLQWKTARKAGEGKLSFTTVGQVEAKVGVGLLRQDHQIDYQILQGELKSLSIQLHGPGEILDVQGSNIVAWKVTGEGDERRLDATLSQPITTVSQIKIRSQTPLGAFPVRVSGLRLDPIGAIRYSGHLRLTNLGSVRLEPTDLTGLTQLSPDQFPGTPVEARQTFVYRFPAADHGFTVAADRIQPEVNVSELVLYQLAETDRLIKADVELDVREAPIREWDFGIPSDYSVVSVTGASVSDYIVGSEVTGGRRNLKVVFSHDVAGRQLLMLHLEKNEAAVEGAWVLPRIEYPDAKTVLGNVGVIGAPGFRIAVEEVNLLVEKPLSYFPKPTPNLQQAFRIREPGWSATMRVELLDRSVQSDVFHLYSLREGTVYGSALINYFVTGAPVSEWRIALSGTLGNVMVDGQDIRTWRREGDMLIVSLHQPIMGAYTLLVTVEEKPDESDGSFKAGQISPADVQGERGYIQVVSPMQVEITTLSISDDMLKLDPLELPAELRLLSTAPPLGTWQYTERPFELNLKVDWFQPGTTATQVVEFAEANSRVSQDGELVTDVLYYVKSRGQRTLRIKLPDAPMRLWEVSVNGQPVTARQTDDATLIPLPGGTDPNIPVEVSLRLGKPAVDETNPQLTLPTVFAPVLKTHWSIVGDETRVLVPNGGTVTPAIPVLRPVGFDWLTKRGIAPLILIGILLGSSAWTRSKAGLLRVAGMLFLAAAISVASFIAWNALSEMEPPLPLQLNLPVLSAGEIVEIRVENVPLWQVYVSGTALIALLVGVVAIVGSFAKIGARAKIFIRCSGILLIALGILFQPDGAPWFFGLLALAILTLLLVPQAIDVIRGIGSWMRQVSERRRANRETSEDSAGADSSGAVTPTVLLFALIVSSFSQACLAAAPEGFEAANSIKQQWQVTQHSRLKASGVISLSGKPGDRFLLLKSPAVLTGFEGEGLRLTKQEVPDQGLNYIISIPTTEKPPAPNNDGKPVEAVVDYEATFEFQLEAIKPMEGVPVLTGTAAVQEISLTYDEDGWDVFSPTAVRVEPVEAAAGTTQVKVLLGPGAANIQFKPKARDVTTEETQFFVEASNLYLPGPGVVDGRHRLHIRPSQGQVSELNVIVPKGLNVSSVSGPVGSWQFDADSGQLTLEIEPTQSQVFDVMIDTQRGLDPLPADVNLAPLKVVGSNGEVGLFAIAFGADAQPEKAEPKIMSAVNLGDFDPSLIPNEQAVLHRVYRYGAEGGELDLRVASVDSDVRVTSRQVLSLGDERVVLGVNFAAEISRAGLFQLSFPLPDGLEVESLTGDSLHHWAELSDGDQRQIILHLNGKTIGVQSFSLVLSGTVPEEVGDWEIPRFELNEATRQIGELVVRPTTGIRLRTVSRQNISETDPRSMGANTQGALAFRLLQRDWKLTLGIEKLDPWVTGQVLHEITLREGQTRSVLLANFRVQNASIRTLQVILPITDEDEIKTLRASGKAVSDLVRTTPNSNVWEIQLKQRVVGRLNFRIEYERRGDRENESESLSPAGFPQARQLSYHFGIRAGGGLEIEHDTLSQGWQRAEWNTVAEILREAGNRNAPSLVLRAVAPANTLAIRAKRHALAAALRLRVAEGSLTTVLSPTGDQLTAVELTVEVIQRSSLSVGLPQDGELISIFVNGESVHSIRQGGKTNAWQFYILPGIDDHTASVRFVYSVPGDRLRRLKLSSPELNVPLENIQWYVVAPKGFELTEHDGNLELIGQQSQENYDRDFYLSKIRGKRQVQAEHAAQLLEQANQLLQAGEQTKARWALNSVANQYALDAASNEDARVQLENLQTQQAIVGLNTRRQRLYLDNSRDDGASVGNEQLRQAAADNPILQQDQLNFRPQELSQLLRGNTSEDNAILHQIASRLVQHQRTTVTAPQAIIISLPEEGTVYTFSRSVQVAENAPLELDLDFGLQRRIHPWQAILVLALLVGLAGTLALVTTRRVAA
jgi:hypothetical protein